jgi:hypothetical protein
VQHGEREKAMGLVSIGDPVKVLEGITGDQQFTVDRGGSGRGCVATSQQ